MFRSSSTFRYLAAGAVLSLYALSGLGHRVAAPPSPHYALPPAFVAVHGKLWRVVYDHRQTAQFWGSPIGHTEESEQAVYVDPESPNARVTTLHELEHALLTVDFSHEEILGHTCVYLTSEQIVTLLRENPELAEYLRGGR